jgi:hypothetical protein
MLRSNLKLPLATALVTSRAHRHEADVNLETILDAQQP